MSNSCYELFYALKYHIKQVKSLNIAFKHKQEVEKLEGK